MRPLLAAALAVAALGVPAHAGPRCANDLELRNHWSPVPLPYTPGPVAVAQDDRDPCLLVATDTARHVFRTTDGGSRWTRTTSVGEDVVRPVLGGLPAGRVALVRSAGGLLVSADDGRTFATAKGLDGVRVLTLRRDPTDQAKLYVTGRTGSPVPAGTLPPAVPPLPSAGPSMWSSTDFGVTWNPVAGSAAFAAANASVDESDPNLMWAADATSGTWLSDSGGAAFVAKDPTPAYDVDTAALEGGGTVVLASTAKGLRRSVDGGDSWTDRLAGTNVRELVFETGHPAAFMMVAAGTIERSSDHGQHAHAEADGLPPGCDPRGLTADGSAPSTFLVTCGSDGRTYRYRDDGRDWGWIDDGSDNNGLGLAPRLPHYGMDLLKQIDLPADEDGLSAAIAFDGQLVYYTDGHNAGVVHRIEARTGRRVSDLAVDVPSIAYGLTYDSLRHRLFVLSGHTTMYQVDLRTGKAKRMFVDPLNTFGYGATSYSYDTAIGAFHAVFDGDGNLYEIDEQGHIMRQCSIPTALLYQRSDGGPPDIGDGGATSGPSAVVASGDGGVYVQTEDDTTVVRLNRSCQPLATFAHRGFSEASMENDQIACDTTTFDVPAVWLRDAEEKAAFAYAVPGGYCALATKLRVTTSPVVANVDRAPVCAELRLAGKGLPVAGEQVTMFVGRHAIGTGTTGGDGVACVPYHPADFPEYVSPPAGPKAIHRRASEHVVANYLGTIAYRPATARGHAVVTTFVPPLAPLPHLPVPPVPPAAIVAAPPPPLPVAPPQPPPPAPQPQPLAQGHPGAQPGAMGQPGAAADRQEEVEVADQSADVHEFTARTPLPSSLPAGVAGFAFAALLLEQRRRRSRVREVAG